jgi:hypothetical protein
MGIVRFALRKQADGLIEHREDATRNRRIAAMRKRSLI